MRGKRMLGFVKLAGGCAPKHLALAALVWTGATCSPLSWGAPSKSVYLSVPPDPAAVQVARDGSSDDTHAIQSAIDQARNNGSGGVVFLPSGHYKITKTLFIWPAVRVFGIGPTRPLIELPDHTPGFDRGVAAMIVF